MQRLRAVKFFFTTLGHDNLIMQTMKKILLTVSLLLITHLASAERPFQLSLTPDIAIVPRGDTVRGLALNVWGENEVQGVSLGLVNGLVGDSRGFTWSYLGTYTESYRGVIWGGFFTRSTGDVVGWQAAMLNMSSGSMVGLQSGLVNIATDVKGVQLGLVNYTENMHGVQVGLINVITANPWFTEFPSKLATGFPIVNWSF
jgi:hypothetical protein